MKNRKKEITLLVIAILVLVSMIIGATYAFFKAQIGPAANFDINATTGTTDNLTFSTEGDIVLNVTAENLKNGGNDLSDSATAKARLIKSNTSESATAYYNVYLLIEENELEYSSYTQEGKEELRFMTKEEKEKADLEGYTGVPELILSVKKGGTEYKISKRLKETDGGYDITEADGLYAIGEDVEITSTDDVTDTWEVTVTYKNLKYNQQLNTGRSLKGKIIITAEKLLYEINNKEELNKLSEEVNAGDTKEGKYYVLTNNIDLGTPQDGVSNFTPIGTDTNRFKGNFNGDNHTISNLYIYNKNDRNGRLGLFGFVSDTSIKNLIISGEIISLVRATIGGIIAENISGNVIVENCINKVNITSKSNEWVTGGIFGNNNSNGTAIIKKCQNYGIISNGITSGGIIGYSNGILTVEDSINYGSLNNELSTYIGGILGWQRNNTNETKIINSSNEGEINLNTELDGTKYIGGMVGNNTGLLNISNSSNNGKIIANLKGNTSSNIGGFIGGSVDATIEIMNSENRNDIILNNGINFTEIGGFVGHLYGANIKIENSKNTAKEIKIIENDKNSKKSRFIGGMIAYVGKYNNIKSAVIIKESYNSANLNGGTHIGGIVGYNTENSDLIINKSYNLGEITSNFSSENSFALGGIIAYSGYGSTNFILNSYNLGNILYNGDDTSQNYCGGIIGHIYTTSSYGITNNYIINSFNKGNITNTTNENLVVGIFEEEHSLQNKIYLNNIYNFGILNGSGKYAICEINTNNYEIKNAFYNDQNIPSSNNSEIGELIINQNMNNFKTTLNNNIKSINLEEIDPILKDYTLVNWKLGEDGYPTLDF